MISERLPQRASHFVGITRPEAVLGRNAESKDTAKTRLSTATDTDATGTRMFPKK